MCGLKNVLNMMMKEKDFLEKQERQESEVGDQLGLDHPETWAIRQGFWINGRVKLKATRLTFMIELQSDQDVYILFRDTDSLGDLAPCRGTLWFLLLILTLPFLMKKAKHALGI
jgi:hypothetical protein